MVPANARMAEDILALFFLHQPIRPVSVPLFIFDGGHGNADLPRLAARGHGPGAARRGFGSGR
jgi:hypothetical protein